MKSLIIILWITILTDNISYAQERKIITNDSLLRMFQVMKPFEVLNKIGFGNMNFKAFYYDTVLKTHLIKWLDRHEYFEYVLDKEKETISNRPDLIKDEILYMLNKKGRGKALDSIITNPMLYAQYRDSAISVYVNRYIESYKGEHEVPDKAITLHSYLAYPEGYAIIKKLWDESGRPTERNEYFIPLVRMGDPDARELYDNRIKQLVKTYGGIPGIVYIDGELNELRNSYSVSKFIELLKVNTHYVAMSDGDPGMPYNCYVINYLLGGILTYSIDIGKVKTSDPCDVQKKHLPEIKAAAKKLIEKYKAEELYWMKNMPFYKGESTGN